MHQLSMRLSIGGGVVSIIEWCLQIMYNPTQRKRCPRLLIITHPKLIGRIKSVLILIIVVIIITVHSVVSAAAIEISKY